MTIIIDNSMLSNFALISEIDLLRLEKNSGFEGPNPISVVDYFLGLGATPNDFMERFEIV